MGVTLLFVGWDGADWQIINRLLEAGGLPNLASLLKSGVSYQLKVPIPPTTFSSWTTILTGTNPACHGITDFSELVAGAYRIRFLTSLDRAEPALWEYFDALGLRSCVLGFPATYPPDEINGFFLAGFESPVATSAEEKFAHPKEIYRKISKELGPWLVGGIQEFKITAGWHSRALEHALMSVERKLNYATELAKNHGPFDVLMVWFGEIDTICHHFWRFYDPSSPRFEPKGLDEFKNAIPLIYHRLDYALGILTNELAPKNVVLVSDHGFGGAGVDVFHINGWLKQKGLLSFKSEVGGWRFLKGVQRLALQHMPAQLQEKIFRANPELAEQIESKVRFGKLDFPHTRAFSEELNYAPSVRLNLFGREAEGTVKQAEAEELLLELIDGLESVESLDGARIIKKAWRKQELYSGPYLERLPELIIEQAYPSSYSVNFLRSSPDSPALRVLDHSELAGAKGAGMNGTHREVGIFIISGPSAHQIIQKETADAKDVAPTSLALFGRRTKKMEGESVYKPSDLTDLICGRKFSRKDANSAIAAKLKNMGYLS